MKKVPLFILLAALFALPVSLASAEEEPLRRPKVGAFLGYPALLATAGFPLGRFMEVNIFVGYDYRDIFPLILSSSASPPAEFPILSIPPPVSGGGIYTGVNLLFTLFEIKIGKAVFPLSLGPQGAFSIGFDGNVRLDVMAVLRLEYTFAIPLNLFIEGGTGAAFNLVGSNLTKIGPVFPASFAGLGIRYVF